MLKEEVLSMLLNAQEPVSGEGICKTLGVTRAAVWKTIDQLRQEGYVPQRYVSHDPQLERCLDALRKGFRDGVSYEDLYQRLIGSDEYLLLADYRAYCDAERRMAEAYENREGWNRMSLRNIARSGIFAADRAVAEYADNIWDVPHR